MTRWLLSLALLTSVYLLILANFDPWNLFAGAVLSAALLLLFQGFLFGGRPRPLTGLATRALAFIPFAAATVWDITLGTWQVALVVLNLRPLVRPGIVAVPMEERTPNGVVVSALVSTLSPGSYLVGTDWDRRVMLFHTLDATDPEAVRRHHSWFYHRYQRHVFP